jgi:enoyl-CoA hydratase/carnithine racemase
MADNDAVLLERDGDVATITLNRPEKLNAVGPTTLADLEARMEEVSRDGAIRAVVLTGAGRAFSAGADLSTGVENQPLTTDMNERFPIRDDSGWPQAWFGVNIPKPVVCAINGAAVGWAAEITVTCDMRVAAESARIGWVFARRGLVTDMAAGPIILPRLVGMSQAARLLYSGEIVNATEALRIGLVDEVVPDGELITRAVALARHLGGGAPYSVAVHKRQLYEGLRRDPHEIYRDNNVEFANCRGMEDFREGVRSFLEKREPAWTGR